MMKQYRIMNNITRDWWEGMADDANQALSKAGWIIKECLVKVRNVHGAWEKCREFESINKIVAQGTGIGN
jgi:hypothetical protein